MKRLVLLLTLACSVCACATTNDKCKLVVPPPDADVHLPRESTCSFSADPTRTLITLSCTKDDMTKLMSFIAKTTEWAKKTWEVCKK